MTKKPRNARPPQNNLFVSFGTDRSARDDAQDALKVIATIRGVTMGAALQDILAKELSAASEELEGRVG